MWLRNKRPLLLQDGCKVLWKPRKLLVVTLSNYPLATLRQAWDDLERGFADFAVVLTAPGPFHFLGWLAWFLPFRRKPSIPRSLSPTPIGERESIQPCRREFVMWQGVVDSRFHGNDGRREWWKAGMTEAREWREAGTWKGGNGGSAGTVEGGNGGRREWWKAGMVEGGNGGSGGMAEWRKRGNGGSAGMTEAREWWKAGMVEAREWWKAGMAEAGEWRNVGSGGMAEARE